MGGRGSASGSGGSGRSVGIASIASRLISLPHPGGVDRVRVERVKAGLAAGKDLGTVSLTQLPNGKLFVNDGRHRLIASRELGVPVRVKIERGPAEVEHGTVPMFK